MSRTYKKLEKKVNNTTFPVMVEAAIRDGNDDEIASSYARVFGDEKATDSNSKVNVADKAIKDASNNNIEDTYAKQDGSYDNLTCGNAKQLESSKKTVDNAPYLYRTSGGQVSIGNRATEKYIEGVSDLPAQLVENGNFESTSGWTARGGTLSASNNKLTYTATSDVSRYGLNVYGNDIDFLESHKYLIVFKVDNISWGGDLTLRFLGGDTAGPIVSNEITLGDNNIIYGVSNSKTDKIAFGRYGAFEIGDSFIISRYCIFDLTQRFGSTIADYLATLTIDQALAKIKPWIDTNKYYPYSATPTFKHVNLLKKKVVGFNLWDEEWEAGYYDATGNPVISSSYWRSKKLFKVISNAQVYFPWKAVRKYGSSGDIGMYVYYYDYNKNFINRVSMWANQNESEWLKTIPSNCYYIKFFFQGLGSTYNHDICINLSWSGKHNGEYKQYEEHIYDMPTDELKGVFKLDEDNNIIYDGDRHYADGNTDVRYDVVDLGTLNWYKNELVWQANFTQGKGADGNLGLIANLLCTKYIADSSSHVWSGNKEKTISLGTNNVLRIYDTSYTDLEAFKNSLDGVYLVYEKATPTTSQGTPYTELQIVDDWGTEEFIPVEGNEVPVGHYTEYPTNNADKVDNLPDNADADGVYLVKQTGSQQSLVATTEIINPLSTVDTQLLNAIGGTLRQCLCVKESLDFVNTDFVDLGELNWTYDNAHNCFYAKISSMKDSSNKIICSNYQTKTTYEMVNKSVTNCPWNVTSELNVYDNSFGTDTTTFKNAMKGVLLAYEKASS